MQHSDKRIFPIAAIPGDHGDSGDLQLYNSLP
jgi:hypothetical protein